MRSCSREALRVGAVMGWRRVLIVSALKVQGFHSSTFGRADGRGAPGVKAAHFGVDPRAASPGHGPGAPLPAFTVEQ